MEEKITFINYNDIFDMFIEKEEENNLVSLSNKENNVTAEKSKT